MATTRKPIVIAKPTTPSIKQMAGTTTPIAKKLVKPDIVAKKPTIGAARITSPTTKLLSKPIVAKMSPTKGWAAAVVQTPVTAATKGSTKSDAAATVVAPKAAVIAKPPAVKRAAADSTSPVIREAPAKPFTIGKSSSATSSSPLTKVSFSPSAAKSAAAAKPVVAGAAADSKSKTGTTVSSSVSKATATVVTRTGCVRKTAAVEPKTCKGAAAATTSAAKSLTKSTTGAEVVRSAVSGKPAATTAGAAGSGALAVRRASLPRRTDAIRRAAAGATATSSSKTAASTTITKSAASRSATPCAALKVCTVRTPLASKVQLSKVCADVQICDADSTSPTTSGDRAEMESQPRSCRRDEDAPACGGGGSDFTEIRAYEVAEQMIEVLGDNVLVSSETDVRIDPLAESVAIDTSSLEAYDDEGKAAQGIDLGSNDENENEDDDCETKILQIDDASLEVLQQAEICDHPITSDENLKTAAEDEQSNATEELGRNSSAEADAAADETESAQNGLVDENRGAELVDHEDRDVRRCAENGDSAAESDDLATTEIFDEEENNYVAENDNSELTELPDEEVAPETENSEILEGTADEDNGVEEENVLDEDSAELEVIDEQFDIERSTEIVELVTETVDERAEIVETTDTVGAVTEPKDNQRTDNADVPHAPHQHDEQTEQITSREVSHINIQENYFGNDRPVIGCEHFHNLRDSAEDFVVVELSAENVDTEIESASNGSVDDDDQFSRTIEKLADDESVASVDSGASYAAAAKQPANTTADNSAILDFEQNEYETIPSDEEEETAVRAAANIADRETGDYDVAAANAENNASSAIAPAADENCAIIEDGDELLEQQLVESMSDDVANELDASVEHLQTNIDEEGYEKVQKKRNKRNNKRNRKSFKSFKNENTDYQPPNEVEGNFGEDNQTFCKRRNSRRTKYSMKKQYRRHSEPYVESHCYAAPVWKSFYAEN